MSKEDQQQADDQVDSDQESAEAIPVFGSSGGRVGTITPGVVTSSGTTEAPE